ncbi:MAG: polyphosphate kinase 1, partial [Proteobacteria bacterium]|nr:polyphosphate kinase 1 [Pseudomonadota bacterium]
IKDDISASYLEQIQESLHQRKLGDLVRMVYDRTMPDFLLTLLVRKLKLTSDTLIETNRRYHNSKDYITFPSLLPTRTILYPEPVVPRRLIPGKSFFDILDEGDVLLNFPYQSFDHVIDFLREAAIDPKVTEIKINLYRLGKHSSVINALINAGKNRKNVMILLELQARFDEKANIHWANVLKDEGIKVIFGVPGLKVHSKVCMITRVKKGVAKTYCLIGSGNFNEDTARYYTDAFLLTANKKIAKDVRNLFGFFGKNYKLDPFEQLLVSPFIFRKKIIKLIRNEIHCMQKGKPAYIDLKLNNLADREIIELLYEASQAGVKIRLAVRGMFSLVTGVKGKSERIEGRGLVDKYLEHSRIFFFGNGGEELCFISSADLLPRNLDSRVEVTCPILDAEVHQELRDIFEHVWADNVKSRILNAKLDNTYFREGKTKVRSQEAIYNYLKMKHQGN